jgi:ribosomal protein S18 acetylase RimI-like enzyme
MAVRIEPAQFPRDSEAIRALFLGYSAALGIDLTFQSFQDELDSLPGRYAESQGGSLLIARAVIDDSDHISAHWEPPFKPTTPPISPAVGCVALRRSPDNWCEMKRLYVVEAARGLKLGDKLVEAIVAQAKTLDYRGIRLDTLPDMTAAQGLYRRYGFVQIEPYYDTPIEGTIFMGCDFTRS